MLAIFKKEIQTFFSTPMGYLVVGVFLLVNSLFLWVFKGEFNILDYGFADLSSFFFLAPWVLIFLIPAVTMKSFSEENKQGTLELLLTKPIKSWQLVLGKYFGVLTLIVIAILPTLLYVYTVYQLGEVKGNIDLGNTFGSYLALFFMICSFSAIGLFSSTITENQIVAFITAIFICFFLYFGFDGLVNFAPEDSDFLIEKLGMNYHFTNMSRGVID
ncbi:MAG: gliding motility-associated ABC transporter permease subunit GldF, partial [Flavobacteriaceae bacterium]|nr:gliding motility-associated ABC transporter permease subunit GldF [Flavobacteriaceae bacterium]